MRCRSCQPSISGCLRWMMLALSSYKLPVSCARYSHYKPIALIGDFQATLEAAGSSVRGSAADVQEARCVFHF